MVALVETIMVLLDKLCLEKNQEKRTFGRQDWDNSKIREGDKIIKIGDKLHQKMVRIKSIADHKAFRKARNQVNLLICCSKGNYYDKKL